ncbi:finger 483-like isoform X2 [Podarcis lilfordi]|uniref:Finger 483-like isoform X2 n=1 Tax=Podarcis lilfordi TaxID=74358 RepID=A0AA35JZ03_9SAUR|nr:finger 483-like isoform X2 [Podarcis lilfordi]
MKMPLKYVKSRKGRDQLLHEGYLYRKERESKSKMIWKCADYHKSRCPGKAHTRHGKLVHSLPHDHPPPAKTAGTDAEMCGTKERPSSSQEPVCKGSVPGCQASPGVPASRKPRIQNDPKLTIQLLRARLNAARQVVSDLQQGSSAVAETVPVDPPSPASLDLPERSSAFENARSKDAPVLGNGTNAPRLFATRSSQEAARQRFRLGPVPPAEAPQEILSWLSEAAERWLCPQQHSKDQIVDMVILEQFLNVLPGNLQACVRARDPGSSKEALQLVESYLREEEPANAVQGLVTFEDVSVRFTEEEWALLGHKEKTLYWNVMQENYDNVAWMSDGTDSKSREEDPWLEACESVAMGKSKEAILQSPEQDMLRQSCLERQQKTNSGREREKDVLCWKSLQKLDRDMVHLEMETCADCEDWGESLSAFINTQESPSKESSKPMTQSGESHELSEKKILQNLQGNLIKEDQSSLLGQQASQERSTLLRNSLRDPLQLDSRPCTDSAELEESLRIGSSQKIHSREDPDYVALEMSVDEISQISAKQDLQSKPTQLCSNLIPAEVNETADLQHKPAHVYSEVSTSGAHSQGSGCRISDSISEDQNVLESHRASISGNDDGQEKCLLYGNGLRDLSKDMLQLDAEPGPENQNSRTDCGGQDQCSKHIVSREMAHREDLYKSPKSNRRFIKNAGQASCSDSGKKPRDLLALMKQRRLYKRGKYFNGENMHAKSVLGVPQRIQPAGKLQKRLDWKDKGLYKLSQCRLLEPRRRLRQPLKDHLQTREALHQTTATIRTASGTGPSPPNPKRLKPEPVSPSPPPLYKMAAEPTLAQFMALLEQVAADAVEIKSAVSRLHTSVTAILSALGSLSGCSDEAELRISDLEDTTRNTKAQLVKQCNDIKAIEAKLIGKAVQTNVIAGLWSSLRGQREAASLHQPPN